MADDVPIESAKTALEILELLAERGPSSLSEIQRATELPRSTAHDYLKTLFDMQYVIKQDGRYRVSTRCLAIGIGVRNDRQLFTLAKPELDSLAEQTGEHASLMIEENGLGVLLYISKGEQALDLGVSEGWRMALPTNAPGKAILAHLPEEEVAEILAEHGMPEVTEATITDREELFEQLAEIRDRGYALDFGERVEGVRAVSVPIVTGDQVHGAITISGPTNRMTEQRFDEQLPALLRQSANVIEVQYTLDTDRT